MLDAIGRMIVSGELEPGTVLRIEEFETRFEVSRTVVREAVRVLESMGLVSSRRRVGVIVGARTGWNVFDPRIIRWRLDGDGREAQLRTLGELRRGFEPVAAGLAADHASPAQCGVLTGAVMEMAVHARSGDLEAYLAADVLFHRTLLEASGNEMLAALAGVVEEVLAGRTHHALMPRTPDPAAVRWHLEVAQAVQSRDTTTAEHLMREIVEEATRSMLTPDPATP
ncbi:FCD domain-containing protein [Actinocorallia lasiicapitis]